MHYEFIERYYHHDIVLGAYFSRDPPKFSEDITEKGLDCCAGGSSGNAVRKI